MGEAFIVYYTHSRIVNFTIFDVRCINPKFEALNPKQYLNPNNQELIAAEFFYNSPSFLSLFWVFDFGPLKLFRD